MESDRRFARYRREEGTQGSRRLWAVPRAGLCLSAFVLLGDVRRPTHVVLGRPDPSAPWDRLAALDSDRIASLAGRRILPASHLIEGEDPRAAANRILREQLEIDTLELRGPEVFSEFYPLRADPSQGPHWDLHFVFRGEWPKHRDLRATAWKELNFLDARSLPADSLGRGHLDILFLAGMPIGTRLT